MPSLPTDPLIHRSVYTRGFYSPSPWARRGAALTYDTPVTFRRHTLVDAGAGTFAPASGPGMPALWATVAHVELETEGGLLVQADGLGPLNRRRYVIICEVPTDTSQLPKRDDYVEFTDAVGQAVRTKVDKADIPLNLADHIEIETEWFQ